MENLRPSQSESQGTILLINGPNLNCLGRREKEHYGSFTLQDVEAEVADALQGTGYDLVSYQSNHEGDLLDFIQENLDRAAGILINAGAFTHYSYALLDCLKLFHRPIIEIHISDIENREEFRKISVIRPACRDWVGGLGLKSYRVGTEKLLHYLSEDSVSEPQA
jgi:3-dehydroquinate dehydratase-2